MIPPPWLVVLILLAAFIAAVVLRAYCKNNMTDPEFNNPNDPPLRPWEPLKLDPEHKQTPKRNVFCNRYYTVFRYQRSVRHSELLIVNADQSARRDWREFQQIKDELLGEHAMAVEVYPPKEHLMDPSNAFILHQVPRDQWGKLPFVRLNGRDLATCDVQRDVAEGLTI